jgi:tetratricopeptide (TPR) repeat protein
LWQRALAINPNNFLAHGNLSVTHVSLQQFDLARHHAAEAVRLRPDFVEQHVQLGILSLLEKKPDEARQHFDRALRARPDAPLTVRRLAAAGAAGGDLDGAIAMLSVCTAAMPADQESRFQLAILLNARGRAVEAAQHYREGLRQQPDRPELLNNLAWLLATSADDAVRNGVEAVTHAERACQLTGRRHAIFIGTLAAAFAEAGRFEDASRAASEAIAVASGAGEYAVVERNRQLLELYRAGKPYHEPAGR